jgi:ubiquinone/menaquinone biosynthesis C-methylase UbiE
MSQEPMKVYTYRSPIGYSFDAITFPFRAVFIHEQSRWGLSSLRDQRMRTVAKYCSGRTLDVGCGPNNIFIRYYHQHPGSIGIDCYPYEGIDNIVENLAAIPFPDASFDTITLIAVGGHIPRSKREVEFREFGRLLKAGGHLLMTEGEPITQFLLHKWQVVYYGLQGKKDMDTERGMHVDEDYCMPKREIYTYLNTSPLKLVKNVKFMWGLNNIYIAQKY